MLASFGMLAVGAAGGTAASAAPAGKHPSVRTIGTLLEAAKGFPKTMRRGDTAYVTFYYRQHSPDTMVPTGFALNLWNMAAPDYHQTLGISATWFNPATHRWEKASHYDSVGVIEFNLPDSPSVKVASGTLAHVYIRLAFGKAAHTGLWHFEPSVSGYEMLTPKGVSDSNYLEDTDRKQYTSTLR